MDNRDWRVRRVGLVEERGRKCRTGERFSNRTEFGVEVVVVVAVKSTGVGKKIGGGGGGGGQFQLIWPNDSKLKRSEPWRLIEEW